MCYYCRMNLIKFQNSPTGMYCSVDKLDRFINHCFGCNKLMSSYMLCVLLSKAPLHWLYFCYCPKWLDGTSWRCHSSTSVISCSYGYFPMRHLSELGWSIKYFFIWSWILTDKERSLCCKNSVSQSALKIISDTFIHHQYYSVCSWFTKIAFRLKLEPKIDFRCLISETRFIFNLWKICKRCITEYIY